MVHEVCKLKPLLSHVYQEKVNLRDGEGRHWGFYSVCTLEGFEKF